MGVGARGQQGPQDLKAAEREAQAFHDEHTGEAIELVDEGLKLFMTGLDPIRGRNLTADDQIAGLGLLLTAWQGLVCALDVAHRGYYLPCLNLLRAPYEYQVAFVYVGMYPEHARRFLDLDLRTPWFNEMTQGIRSRAAADEKAAVDAAAEWISRLHPFSHVDRFGMNMIVRQEGTRLGFHPGPQVDAGLFRWCMSQLVHVLTLILESLDHLRRAMALPPLTEWREYWQQVTAWRHKYGIVPDPEPGAP